MSLLSKYSLEITARGLPGLEAAAASIPAGTRISITFIASESDAARLQAARGVRRLGFVPVPHLAARRIRSEDELEGFLAALTDQAQVDEVLVVGGDPAQSKGPYEDALALIESGILKQHAIRRASIAGYPEGHPDISAAQLNEVTALKLSSLRRQGMAPAIVTQFGFEAEPIVDWIASQRAQGIHCPIQVGVAGPARASTLLRFAARCGVGASARIMSRYGVSLARLISTVGPSALVSSLMGALDEKSIQEDVSLHLYSFERIQDTARWIQSFHPTRNIVRSS